MSHQTKDAVKSEQPMKEYPLVEIRGLPFPAPFVLSSTIENALDFKPQDTDIFVTTYPKCGTTWTQFIVWEIIHKGAVPPSPNQMMFRDFPFLEFTGPEILDELTFPRTLKTHLPFNLQPYNPKAKYIYVVRNPWDCCVSYYHHNQMAQPMMPDLTFDEYFKLFIEGKVGWGDFFDHVLSWFEHRHDSNVLFLTYENMKKNKKKAILSIAKFLGDSFYECLKDESVLNNCLKYTDFNYMKGIGMFFPKGTEGADVKDVLNRLGSVDSRLTNPDSEGLKQVNFFRKGEVGDWKNYFSPTHIKTFNEYMLMKLKNTEMENFWQPLLEETSL